MSLDLDIAWALNWASDVLRFARCINLLRAPPFLYYRRVEGRPQLSHRKGSGAAVRTDRGRSGSSCRATASDPRRAGTLSTTDSRGCTGRSYEGSVKKLLNPGLVIKNTPDRRGACTPTAPPMMRKGRKVNDDREVPRVPTLAHLDNSGLPAIGARGQAKQASGRAGNASPTAGFTLSAPGGDHRLVLSRGGNYPRA